MRSALYCGNPVVPVQDDQPAPQGLSWQTHRPMTNVLWLQFILVALRGRLSAARSSIEGQPDSVDDSSGKDTGALNRTCVKRLAAVEALLDPAKLASRTQWSAGAVLDYAFKRRWLCEDDIVANDWDDEGALGP
jgi:hypothetical protein